MYPDLLERIRPTTAKDRGTFRDLAEATGIPKSVLFDRFKAAYFKKYTRPLKPQLTPANLYFRSKWASSHITSDSSVDSMENYVHVDEKWFFLKMAKCTFYGLPDKAPPARHTKNKNFITKVYNDIDRMIELNSKVMFLCAVAKPRWDSDNSEWWDGKIGCWPLTHKIAAVRSSKNRAKGTLVTAPLSANRMVYKSLVVDKVIPAIKAQWPLCYSKTIKLQQDNASPHVQVDNVDILQAGHSGGFRISVVCQPPNSPDLNVLDLGFFQALQSNQIKRDAISIDDIIMNVTSAWRDISYSTLLANFRTLQQVMIEILKCNGANDYKIPHINKSQLERQGRLPEQPECPREIVTAARALLDGEDEEEHQINAAKESVQLADDLALCDALEELRVGDEDFLCDEFDEMIVDSTSDLVL
ncbi:hypothetical protein AeNC1_006185 [Aphanomyces euteiches]|nr:hypothetical protein AeNC1_006185 [Aphanomyces euteiches]